MKQQLLTISFLVAFLASFSQPGRTSSGTIGFLIPDTVCAGESFVITNLSQGVSTYYWSFCTGNAGTDPLGFSVPSPPLTYSQPGYISIAEDGGQIFSFITNMGNGTITRNIHPRNMMAPPVSTVNMGNFSTLNTNLKGIQIKKDNGNWYGFAADETLILGLDFGSSLLNSPTTHVFAAVIDTVSKMNGLVIVNDGTRWIGFCTNILGNSVTRLNWGTSLSNTPAGISLGNIGGLNSPWQCTVIKQDTNWFMLVANEGDNTLSRLSFGNSLMNIPAGVNLGNVGSLDQNEGLLLVRDCGALNGYALNHVAGPDVLIRLNLPGDASGPITGQSIGNIGSLSEPATFSELVRLGDTLYTFVTNPGNSTVSMLYFPGCTSASVPSSTLKDPPPISYSVPGQYNIMLVTDEGLPTQQNLCKPIMVMPKVTVNMGNDTLVCSGKTMTLDAGPGYTHYLWSTGDTTQVIQTKNAGTFWVHVTNRWNCDDSDTVTITRLPAVTSTVDTAICYGASYFAGGGFQSSPGTYRDTLQTAAGCDSILVTLLSVKQRIPVDLGSDQVICPGDEIILDAAVPGATYVWQNSSTDSTFTVHDPGLYWVYVTLNKCTVGDSVLIKACPAELWFPNAFTPNSDGTNDLFRPKGISIQRFHLEIYDRWGTRVFETDDMEQGWDGKSGGELCLAGTYTYIATWESTEDPGNTRKSKGTFILLR
jgi:gliding motility-associated-like protein